MTSWMFLVTRVYKWYLYYSENELNFLLKHGNTAEAIVYTVQHVIFFFVHFNAKYI